MSKPRVAIIGLGLLGSSLGMALRGKPYRRLAWTRRAEIRTAAIEQNVADEIFYTPQEAIRNADLTVLALPIPQIVSFLRDYAECWQPGSIVTDLGSIKYEIMLAASALPPKVTYIGSHPMAGTEKSGFAAGFAELYQNADVFICPDARATAEQIELIKQFWRQVGGHPAVIDAYHHDEVVARTSHVLHVLASALSTSILDSDDPQYRQDLFRGCATGFRDTSRIASSNPRMWREIIEHNRPAVLAALKEFDLVYSRLKSEIESGDFDGFERDFARGKALRDSWLEYKQRQK